MKVQIIHLDPSDDRDSTRDKLGWIQAPRTLLVWPGRGSVLASRLDLQLVARTARLRGSTLGLVTHDPTVRDHAGDLGIPVFDSIDDLPEERWHVARNGGRQPRAARESSADRVELRRRLQAQRAGERQLSTFARWFIFTPAVLAVVALLVFIAPSADIVLVPKTERQSIDLTLLLDPDGGASTAEGRLQARRIETTLTAELRTSTTGFALAPSGLAEGVVVFTNLTGEAITVPAGTGVRPGGDPASPRFTTLRTLTLEAKEGAQDSVEVRAVDPGPSGNLPSGALDAVEGPIGLLVSATNPDRTTGGRSGPQPGVSQGDAQDLELEVRRMILSQAEQALGEQLKGDEVLAPDSLSISQVLDKAFDHAIGEPAESLKLQLQATVSGLAYSRSDLVEVAGDRLDAAIQPGTESVPGSLSYEELARSEGVGNRPASIRIRVWREIFPHLDIVQARRLVRGLDMTEAIVVLARNFELGALPRIRLYPAWWPRLPYLDSRIAVHWPWGARR